MNGIIMLVLGFILGAVVAVTAMVRLTAYLLKNDEVFKRTARNLDPTGETQDAIVRFFYGDEKK